MHFLLSFLNPKGENKVPLPNPCLQIKGVVQGSVERISTTLYQILQTASVQYALSFRKMFVPFLSKCFVYYNTDLK